MKGIHRRGFMTGAAVAAGSATALAGNGALAAVAETAQVDAIRIGARANGQDDDHPVLQAAVNKMKDAHVLSLPPGRYHLSKPLSVSVNRGVVLGFGAILDNTLILRGREMRVLGVSVIGSPGEGFHIARGQGAHYEALCARENKGAGFMLGGGNNEQIAWANFIGCMALINGGHGWHLDATHKRSWINANTFTGCWSRGNQGMGWFSEGHANYNSWMGCEVENNCKAMPDQPPVLLGGGQNFLFGGHFKDTKLKGVAMRFTNGRDSMVFGGRYVGRIEGASFVQAHVVSSVARRWLRQQDDDDNGG